MTQDQKAALVDLMRLRVAAHNAIRTPKVLRKIADILATNRDAETGKTA